MPEQDEIQKFMGKIDERTGYILHELEEVSAHLESQNGTLKTHGEIVAKHEEAINGKDGLCEEIKTVKTNQTKLILAVGAIAATIGGGIAELVKILGS